MPDFDRRVAPPRYAARRRAARPNRAPLLVVPLAGAVVVVALVVVGMGVLGGSKSTHSPASAPTGTVVAATPTLSTAASGSPFATSSGSAPADGAIYPVPTLALPAPADAPAAVLNANASAILDDAVSSARSQGGFPGIVASVVFPDGSIWTGASGSAVLSSRTPATADTQFSIGSISKTFVAALALRLAEKGTLGLDDPLSKYVPNFPNASHISLRQLLDHRSGVRDVFDSASMNKAILSNPGKVWTVGEVLGRITTPYFAPGRGYHYSNSNYILLGAAIEKATGKTIASLVRSEFLDPLGLKNTWFQPEETPPTPSFAHGYMGSASKPRDVSAGQKMLPYNSEATVAGAAGGFISTAPDLARWASALYAGGVLDRADLAAMVDVSPTLPYKPAYPYGFGFEQTTISGRLAWGHRGHLDGFWSAMWYLPDSGITIVILTNDEWTNTQATTAVFVGALLGK